VAEDLSITRPTVAEFPTRAASVHARKFAIAYTALALVAVGAVGAVVWAVGLERKEERAWSSWSPTRSGESSLWEITDHVGAKYVDARGRPMVQLLVSPPYVTQATEQGVTRIAVDGVIVKGRASDRSDARAGVFATGGAFMYTLCSTGGNCALTPEQNRSNTLGVMLQREILELALYTFKYNGDVEQLLLFLPPFRTLDATGAGQEVKSVVYLERDDLKAALASPLDETLPGSPGQAVDARDRAAVLSYVRPKLFTFEPEQGPQGVTLLTLTPLGVQ
jgi:hypothetical protein